MTGAGEVTLVLTVVAAALACPPAGGDGAPAGAVRSSAGCGTPAPAAPGETAAFSMVAGELEREYRLHLPVGYRPDRPVSLVLDFHGYTATAASSELYTGLSEHADAHGYAVVYPQGTSFVTDTGDRITSWNDLAGSRSSGPEGPICSSGAFEYPHPPECGEPTPCTWASCHDDLGFVRRLLDRLERAVCVDLDRVYATGMSNGGMFVHRLGCAMPERFAAIAPVGGTLARGFNCAPGPDTPLSIMNIYGRQDHYVSQERPESSDGYFYTQATELLDRWADSRGQGCVSSSTPYPTSRDGVRGLECVQRAGCATGAEVVHCTWDGGHDWPRDGALDFGNSIVWEFFSKHSGSGR